MAWGKITSGNDDLKAIEALTGTSGFLKKTKANTWALDTNTYLTSYTETDTNYDFITNKYKITGNYGSAYYTVNTEGKYNDTIQFLFYIKVLSGGTSNYLQVIN